MGHPCHLLPASIHAHHKQQAKAKAVRACLSMPLLCAQLWQTCMHHVALLVFVHVPSHPHAEPASYKAWPRQPCPTSA